MLVGDVGELDELRWPAFSRAAMSSGVRAVFALPVALARAPVGALDLFRDEAGPLTEIGLERGSWAAELAALPLLALMTEVGSALDDGDGWDQLASLERVEVYQATGMIIGHLDVDASEALVRLRAYAFSQGLTASEAAWAIVERRVSLTEDESFRITPGDSDGRRP